MKNDKMIHIKWDQYPSILGTHKFEILDISTEWCNPCNYMKKEVFPKIVKTFSDKDVLVYLIDGDELSNIMQVKMLIEKIKPVFNGGIIKKEKIIKLLVDEKMAVDWDGESKESLAEQILSSLIDGGIINAKKDGLSLNLSDEVKKKIEYKNPSEEFDVDGYPTMIFFKEGKPITIPIDEKDLDSRGLVEYNEENLSKYPNREVIEVSLQGKTCKYIRTVVHGDARRVGSCKPESMIKSLTSLFKKLNI